jgi:deoxyadenosine/deoxycytidine kinase
MPTSPQSNLFYFSGPHGSGKTTLTNLLQKYDVRFVIPDLVTNAVKFDTEPVHRQLLKIFERALENYEYLGIAKKNPDKIIMGNRCVYGVRAYIDVYFQRGWIDEKTKSYYLDLAKHAFKDENDEPYAVILNPGFDVVKRHLHKRWKEKEKKWNEDDEEYTFLACRAYERFRDKDKIFYIDEEVDLGDSSLVKELSGWMKVKSGIGVGLEEKVLVG